MYFLLCRLKQRIQQSVAVWAFLSLPSYPLNLPFPPSPLLGLLRIHSLSGSCPEWQDDTQELLVSDLRQVSLWLSPDYWRKPNPFSCRGALSQPLGYFKSRLVLGPLSSLYHSSTFGYQLSVFTVGGLPSPLCLEEYGDNLCLVLTSLSHSFSELVWESKKLRKSLPCHHFQLPTVGTDGAFEPICYISWWPALHGRGWTADRAKR